MNTTTYKHRKVSRHTDLRRDPLTFKSKDIECTHNKIRTFITTNNFYYFYPLTGLYLCNPVHDFDSIVSHSIYASVRLSNRFFQFHIYDIKSSSV